MTFQKYIEKLYELTGIPSYLEKYLHMNLSDAASQTFTIFYSNENLKVQAFYYLNSSNN